MRDSLCTLLHALAPRTTSAGPTCSSTCCPRCGGKMRLVALVQEPENIARYLRHLGLTTEVPPMAPLSGLGPARPAPAPRGFAAPVACPKTTVLAEPRSSPPLRHAPRRGRSVGGVCSRCSDRLLPPAPLANAERPPSALRRETRWQGLGFASGSSSLCLLGRVSRPPIRSSPPHQTGPEALCFGYGPPLPKELPPPASKKVERW